MRVEWRQVQVWCRKTQQDAEINREVDSILEQSLKDAAYYAKHVSRTTATDRAYWKAATVRLIFVSADSILSQSNFGCFVAQTYQSANDEDKYQILLRCPLKHLCSCPVAHKLFYTKDKVVLKASGEHTLSSHIQDNCKQNLSVSQRAMLRISVKCAPTATGREHVRNTSNFSPDKRTPGKDSYAIRSAQHVYWWCAAEFRA